MDPEELRRLLIELKDEIAFIGGQLKLRNLIEIETVRLLKGVDRNEIPVSVERKLDDLKAMVERGYS